MAHATRGDEPHVVDRLTQQTVRMLDGVRVVELGVWVAGPAAGGVLADWGADVNRGKRSIVLDLRTEVRGR